MNLEILDGCFDPNDIEWRIQQSGIKNGKIWAMVIPYISNRAIMNRLDEVVGKENWKNKYRTGVDGGVICEISIKIDGEWITKEDGAENTNIEAVKGGLSGAMKRCAVQWGIGRYLYNLDAGWAIVNQDGKNKGVVKDEQNKKIYFNWDPPKLPNWAMPNYNQEKATEEPKGNFSKMFQLVQVTKDIESLRKIYLDFGNYSWSDQEIKELKEVVNIKKESLGGN